MAELPLQSMWKKSIVSASPRLQRLLLRLAHYDINIEFLWGKENVIADALSRVCPLQSNNSKIKDSNFDVIPIHHITQSAPVSRTRLQELILATQSDPTLHSLAKTVYEDCPKQLLDFWIFRQEINEEDGLLYKNQRLIVPHSERLETLSLAPKTLCCKQNVAEGTQDCILARNQQGHSQTVPELQDLHQTL